MTKRFNLLLLVLLLLLGLPYYWLLLDNRPGDAAPRPISIGQLRQLAGSIPGQAPHAVEMELVAFRRLPGNLMVAGAGMKRKLVGVMVWQLPVKDGRPVVIDSGLTQSAAHEMGFEEYRTDAAARVETALRAAGLILITHEHIDHEGGLVALNDPAVMSRARLNPDQISDNRWADMLPWMQGARPQPALAGSEPMAVAPGIVVIPAPSHTPGSQMIFVRLTDGREFLFAGDIASFAQNWQETRARSRLVGDWFAPEDRPAVYSWLHTIRILKQAAPGLSIVPGHDFEALINRRAPSGVSLGFSAPSL